MPVFGMGQAAGRPGMGAPQMNETYTGPKPAAWRPPPGMGPPPPRPPGAQRISDTPGAMQGLAAGAGQLMGGRPPPPGAGPLGGRDQAAFQAKQAQALAASRAAGAPPPPQYGGGRPPPPNMPVPGGGAQFGRPPPPGMGMQAAGFNPRQAPPAGQFAQRFPGAQAPRQPMVGGAFGMRPPPGGGGQFGAPTKAPNMAGRFPSMGGGMSPRFGSR